MKKLLFLFVILNLFWQLVFAQQYNPFPKTSGYWKEQFGSVICLDPWMISDLCQTYQFQLEGDTLIDTNNYKKTYYSGRYPEGTYFDMGYVGGLRDDTLNKKVYFLEKDSVNEVLLYDFNLSEGDTFTQPSLYQFPHGYDQGGTFTIGTIDSVLMGTRYVKRFYIMGAGDGEYLIEGMGTTMGLFTHVYSYFEEHNELLCFKNNDNIEYYDSLIWNNDCDFISDIEEIKSNTITLYPNPATTTLTIESTPDSYRDYSPQTIVAIYNTQGQELSHPLSRGECASLSAGKGCVIDISHLPTGLYYLTLQSNEGVATKKFEVIR